MGEAKRRGTYEERRRLALSRKLTPLTEEEQAFLNQPSDESQAAIDEALALIEENNKEI